MSDQELFVGQGFLRLKLDTSIDLSLATDPKILYRKPSGTTGEWEGIITTNRYVTYDLADTDIDQAGDWTFQASVDIGGDLAISKKAYLTFKNRIV